MKSALRQIIITIAAASAALSAPVGICLHAYSPEAPADKIQCFEFSKVEKAGSDYRFFFEPRGSAIVTKYRFRGIIPYNSELVPGHPGFQQLLQQYEKVASATPSTRRFLNPRIVNMRFLAAEQSAEQQVRETLPKIELEGTTYLEPSFSGIQDGKLSLRHRDGTAKIELSRITDEQLQDLVKIDTKAAEIKVVRIAKQRLWNPSFQEMSSTTLKIKHEKGVLQLKFDQLSENDKKTIMSWSDGTWKIEKIGFYYPKSDGNSYGELVLESGKFYTGVKLEDRDGESIIVKTAKEQLKLPINQLAGIPGLTTKDSTRIKTWETEIVNDRIMRASPETSTKVLSFDEAEVLRVTDVRVRILQVLDEGVLASKFVGKLHKGTEKVQTIQTVTVKHPVTGAEISKVIDTKVRRYQVTEDVTDDLCYIVGNTANLTENQIVKADSMRLLGRYQYTDVAGRPRTVRKYHVD